MGFPSPFEVARTTGNNLAGSFKRVEDENAIESILSEASKSGDPEVLHQTIGKILSQVSPERQGAAIKYIESAYERVVEKKKTEKEESITQKKIESAEKGGYDPYAPPAVQAAQVKDKAKSERLAQYGLGGEQPQSGTTPNPQDSINPQPIQDTQSIFKKLSDDQLVVASGAPDREVSEPAKSELKRRADERDLNQKIKDSTRKYHTEISQEILKENEKEAQNIYQAESALGLMEGAIVGKDLSFWTPDNLAEITGIEAFRSQEGAIFKTAGKEFFLGTLNRAGARPNQFIEKQIVEMLPKMGRSTAANLSVARAFRNEIDLKKEKIRLTRDLADELESKLGYIPRNIGQLRDEKLKEYADKKQKELNNDLRAYKAIEDKSIQPFMKVEQGTPISKVVAKALLDQFDKKDPERTKKAAKQAKELGYIF